jgi:YD repeat-containing protein
MTRRKSSAGSEAARPLSNEQTVSGPHGETTTLTLDANGYLSSIAGPVAGDTTVLTYKTDAAAGENGLLMTLEDPRHFVHTFGYEPDGRLNSDVDALGSSVGTRLSVPSTTLTGLAPSVVITSPEGRASTYATDSSPSNGSPDRTALYTNTSPSGLISTEERSPLSRIASFPAGGAPAAMTTTTTRFEPDPRFGMTVPRASSVKTDTLSANVREITKLLGPTKWSYFYLYAAGCSRRPLRPPARRAPTTRRGGC